MKSKEASIKTVLECGGHNSRHWFGSGYDLSSIVVRLDEQLLLSQRSQDGRCQRKIKAMTTILPSQNPSSVVMEVEVGEILWRRRLV